ARRNLVAERKGEHRRVIAERAHSLGDLAADRALQRTIVEERDVLRPWEADHDAQPFGRRGVEQIAVRRRVGANGVDAELRHLTEVGRDLPERWELITVVVRREGAVGDALDEKTIAVVQRTAARIRLAQKFPVDRDTRGYRRLKSPAHVRIRV